MENIALHIEYLLLSHDCVIVPGFGAFIVGYEAPVLDQQSGMITPMIREVRFNSALRSDDGLISGSYARKYGISYREASDLLSKDISALTSLLSEEGEVTLGNIGVIRTTENGNLLFTPLRSARQLVKDLGFLEVPFTENPSSALKQQLGMEVAVEGSKVINNEESSVDSEVREERKLDFKRNYYIAVNKVFAKVAASIILVLAVGVMALVPPSERDVREDRASVVPVDRILEEKNFNNTVGDSELSQVGDEIFPESEEETISDIYPEYFLIVGTFRTESEAEKFVAYHSGCNYDLEIIPSGKVVRVSARRSKARDELQMEMVSPTLREAFAESWIWVKEK